MIKVRDQHRSVDGYHPVYPTLGIGFDVRCEVWVVRVLYCWRGEDAGEDVVWGTGVGFWVDVGLELGYGLEGEGEKEGFKFVWLLHQLCSRKGTGNGRPWKDEISEANWRR